MNFNSKNSQFLILVFLSVIVSVTSFSIEGLPIFILSGGIFIIISYLYDIKRIVISLVVFFLATSIVLDDYLAIMLLTIFIPFLLIGYFMKTSYRDWTVFLIGFPILAFSVSLCIYTVDYLDIINMNEYMDLLVTQSKTILENAGVPLVSFDEIKIAKALKNEFPSGIVKLSIYACIINISLARGYLVKKSENFSFAPFSFFSLPFMIFVPQFLFILILYMGIPYGDYFNTVFNNMETIYQTLIALQGLSVIFFMISRIKGSLNVIFKVLMVMGFFYSPLIFSFLGFFDIMFNLRRLPKRR